LFFLAIYKILLGSNDDDERNFFEYIFNPFTRLNYAALVSFKLGHGLDSAYCLFPTLQYSSDCGGEKFKFEYLSSHSKVGVGFPGLSKYSGVAIPLPVYIYNIFGFLGLFITVYVILITVKIHSFTKNSQVSISFRVFAFVILISLVSALIEDMLFLQYIDISVATIFALFILRGIIGYKNKIRLY
jgi:hypothetical protein